MLAGFARSGSQSHPPLSKNPRSANDDACVCCTVGSRLRWEWKTRVGLASLTSYQRWLRNVCVRRQRDCIPGSPAAFSIPKSRDWPSHNPGISGWKNTPRITLIVTPPHPNFCACNMQKNLVIEHVVVIGRFSCNMQVTNISTCFLLCW